ncbi:MAG: acyl--CoA ligase [Alphaproteobacteria bacterium]|nr:acyl--CoA ligase [Alphaproteobacteria bacterium]
MTAAEKAPRYSAAMVERFTRGGYWNDDTLITYLDRWAAETPDKAAIRTADRDISYGELHAAARRLANSLLDLGVGKQDVVAIQMPNWPEFLITYFGTMMMGGVLATMHMPYRGGEMEPLLRHGEAKAVVCTGPLPNHDAPATMLALRERVPSLEHVIVAGGDVPAGALSLNALIAGGSDRAIADPPGPEDFCTLCFTSGTSAAPKGVMREHRTFAANARNFAPAVELGAEDVVMLAPPFTHVFGLCCTNLALWVGGTSLLLPLFTPETYAERLINGRPTVVFSAPAHLAATVKSGLLDNADLSSIRDVITGGSICAPVVASSFEACLSAGRVGHLFGMTEMILATQTPLDSAPERRHGSAGPCTNGVEARVSDPQGNILGPSEEGELEVMSYANLAGYLNNEAANKAAFTDDGWFRTGDLAIIDEDGFIEVTGRVKDLINRGGIKFNPTDLENALMAHGSIVQAAVVPMPDEVLGEKACLFVTVTPGASLSFDEMTEHLASRGFAKMTWPERLEIIDEMPITPTRKIIKGELIARLQGG